MSLDLKVCEVLMAYKVSMIEDYRLDYHGHIDHERREIYINKKARERDIYFRMSQLFGEAYRRMYGLDKEVDEE